MGDATAIQIAVYTEEKMFKLNYFCGDFYGE
jgi:hypothetical protein